MGGDSRHKQRPTLFVLGQNAQRYPDLIQAEYDGGHAIANHTYDHQSLSNLGREAFFDEVQSTQGILGDKGGLPAAALRRDRFVHACARGGAGV